MSQSTKTTHELGPVLGPWLRRVGALVGCATLLGCLVRERCYQDADCQGPSFCSGVGECQRGCSKDSDCEATAGIEYVCGKDHRCTMPAACTLCAFDNAASSCVHGDCIMGACADGYWDINADPKDGCEYGCVPSPDPTEWCDEQDNDCDGQVDEDTQLTSELQNCGSCGNQCPTPDHAVPVCASGECRFSCQDGFFDNNQLPEDGCEAAECVPTQELCDGQDNDCDCTADSNGDQTVCGPGDTGVDEGFDKNIPESCGPFCVACHFDNAVALCQNGQCVMGSCSNGWYDRDGRAVNGCESDCEPTNDGVEVCDGQDNDCNGLVDDGTVCCPSDMVAVGLSLCVDRYEASRPDATAASVGSGSSVAKSQPGVMPWVANPMNSERFAEFQAACQAADKRLCSRDEWYAACAGPEDQPYVYGGTFNREACNCVDTYCDDYCAEQGIASCSTSSNCGYTYNCFEQVPTGSFPGCTNSYGTFDINGNLWEIVTSSADSRGYEVRGGAFNCANPSERVGCGFNATWAELYAGFRCCRDPL